jgi:hypothetical protein
MVAGGTVMAVWTWVLNEPFGVTGLVAGATRTHQRLNVVVGDRLTPRFDGVPLGLA